MNRNDLVKMAAIGIAAGLCLSMQMAPEKKGQNSEVAMSKCTRDKDKESGSCGSCNGDDHGSCNSCSDTSDASSNVKHKRKSAARRVLEGD